MSTQPQIAQPIVSTRIMQAVRFALVLTTLYVASVILNSLLSFVVIVAACVLGAMCVKVLKSIQNIVAGVSNQSLDKQQAHSISTISQANRNNTSENISHNDESMNRDKDISSNEQVSVLQQESSIVSSKYGKYIVSDCAVFIISRTLVIALASHLGINLATNLAFISSVVVVLMMPDNFISKKIENAANVVGESILYTAHNALDNAFIKKPAEFICDGVTQIYNYIGVELS